jgi:hypothetical protein
MVTWPRRNELREADPGYRKQSTRSGRARGCFIYIDAETLRRSGVDPALPPPRYRLWNGRRGSLLVTLYREA